MFHILRFRQTMRGVLVVKIVNILFELTSAAPQCDMTTYKELDEGIMGQSSNFNWLGILQVFLNDGDSTNVAVTGIVLVRANYALVSADDIVRIPKRIFQHNTCATFIWHGDVAVNYSLVSYVTHPEYREETSNSIAIILLNINDHNSLVPICFPIVSYDTSYLYLTGFTEENDILEKTIYRIQYTDRPECEEFYKKEGFDVENRQPVSYICGKGQSSRKRCVWGNGMALLSNTSGWFTLIGFSIHGPGCAAPARFISMLHYSAWIQEVTLDKVVVQEDDYDYTSSDFRRTNRLDSEFVPIHTTFTAETDQSEDTLTGDRRAALQEVSNNEYVQWPFPIDTLEHFNIMPSEDNSDAIWIMPFNETNEYLRAACSDERKELQYAEDFTLDARPGRIGTVTYQFSLYDLFLVQCTCVTLKVDSTDRTEAFIEFRESFDVPTSYDPVTPEKYLQFVLVTERGQIFDKIENNPYVRPAFIESEAPYKVHHKSYDLSIRFNFTEKAIMKLRMYSTEPSTQYRRVVKKKNKFPKKKMHYWGSSVPADKSVKTAPLVAEHEVVLDTVSDARRSDVTLGVVIIWCLLITASSTRNIFL